MNHIHVINQVNDKSAEHNQPVYMAFINCKNAFDSTDMPATMDASLNQGAQEASAYVNILGNNYNDSTATLLLHNKKLKIAHQERGQARRHNLSNAIHSMLRSIQATRL